MSRIAKDVLAVPITSVAAVPNPHSVWWQGFAKYRSSLRTDNVEAFLTTQNWLFGYLKDDEVRDCFEVMKDVMHDDVDHDSFPQMPIGSYCWQLFHILEFSDEMPVRTYAWELSFSLENV
ncbi:Zinc finger BED domain-containing protein RICESLEEPER 4 [Bienertia sinuspersici]